MFGIQAGHKASHRRLFPGKFLENWLNKLGQQWMFGRRDNLDTLQEQLDAVLGSDPAQTLRRLNRTLRAMVADETKARSRLRVLDAVGERAEPELSAIEIALDRAVLPLSSTVQQSARSADRLLRALAYGYSESAAEISGRWGKLRFRMSLHSAVIHAMEAEARRLRLAYRCYSRGSYRAWAQLHRLYALACREGFAGVAGEDGIATPKRLYVEALLLALAQPNTFAAGQLHRARAYVGQYGHLATLEPILIPPASHIARFVVKPDEARPARALRKIAPTAIRPNDLLLDCVRLVRKTQTQLAGLRTRVSQAKLGLPPEGGRAEALALLHNLNLRWNATRGRRYQRISLNPRVDVVAGFERLWNYLDGPAFRRRSDDAQQPAPSFPGGCSEWTVLNLSPEGLALRYISGNASGIRVGEVVAVRQRDRRGLDVCVARQAHNANVAKLFLGLEVLGPNAQPVTVEWDHPEEGCALQGILVPRMPMYNDACGLLVPLGALRVVGDITVRHDSQTLRMRVDRRLERTSSCDVFTLTRVATEDREHPS